MPIFTKLRVTLFCLFFWMLADQAQSQTSWINLGPDGGDYDAMAIDFKNPSVMYAGTRSGQIYKTVNEGQSWTFLTNVQDYITKLIVDSSNGSRIYAGTSNGNIFYSIDGGASWSQSLTTIGNEHIGFINDIQINPLNPTQLFTFDNEKLYKSLNGGKSWQKVKTLGDSLNLLTAFAFDPQNPSGKMYAASGIALFASANGGADFGSPILNLLPGWRIAKIYVEQNITSTVHILVGRADSTKILRSNNGGALWTVTYASNKGLTAGYVQSNFFSWQQRSIGSSEHVVASPIGLLKTNTGGASWYPLLSALGDLNLIRGGTLVRSSADTGRFYANYDKNATKMTITSSGIVSLTEITIGLNANDIKKILFANGPFIVAQTGTQDLIASLNYGSDYEVIAGIGGNNDIRVFDYYQGPVISSDLDDTARYVLQSGKIFDTRQMAVWDSVDFPLGMNLVNDAVSFHYSFGVASPIGMVAAVGSISNPNGAVIVSSNFGRSWQVLDATPFIGNKVKRVAAYYDQARQVTRIFASTAGKIYYMPYGQSSTWREIYSDAGNSIQNFVTDRNPDVRNSILVWRQGNRLEFGNLDHGSQLYQYEDISSSILELIPTGGAIQNLFTGDDGFYLLLDTYSGNSGFRRIFKTSFANNVHWAEITESPVDQLRVVNLVTLRDKSNNVSVYAAANNGIWTLSQTAIVTRDTAVASLPTSVASDSTVLLVNFYNDGTANLDLDSIAISGDNSSAFRIKEPQGHYVVQLKSVLQVPVVFKPQTVGIKQATLRAVYRVRASTGDSTVVLTTRLTGNTKASRITTNLKGDSLDVRGVLLNATATASFMLANTGDDALYISNIYMQSGTKFNIVDVNGTDSTQLTVLPSRSIPITISFTPDSNRSYEDNLIIRSSAYNFISNNQDSLHSFKILGTGSAISFDESSVDAQLNNDLNIDITLQKLNISDLSGIIKYRATGSGNAGYKQRALAPKPGAVGTNAVLRATIPSNEITEAGLEFFIQISSGATTIEFPENGEFNPYALSVSVKSVPGLNSSSTLTLPGGTSNKAYRLVSFPLALNDETPQGAFAASNMGELGDKGDWQLYRYDNSQFIKASDGSFGTITSGQSYLCISRKPKILNSGTGKTVKPEEAIAQINGGWNMISDPYTFDISWLVIANLNDKIDLTNLVVLDNGRFKYVDQEQALSLKLEPWKGYFYYSDPDRGSFTLHYPAINATIAEKISQSQKSRWLAEYNLGSNEFSIALKIKSESDDDYSTFRLGELQGAQMGLDRFDKQLLPALTPDEVQLQFVNEQKIYLNSEFKPISEDGNYWDFEIKTASGKEEVELSWSGIETVSPDREIVLVDRDRATKIDLKTAQKVLLSVSASETHHYRLFIGTKQYVESTEQLTVPASFYLAQNYPNPFNPTTTIRYGLPQTARVQLIIYNTLGQRVRALVNAEQSAASYNVLWDGRNDHGVGVASGMYIYRLEVRTADAKKAFTQTHKMIFVK